MAIKRKTRMYEPWGYIDENNYQGAETILENDLESFFAQVEYKRDDNKIHFANKDGEEKATLDVSEFVKSDSIVENAWYEDGKIYIKFTNGDVITVDVEELIDQNEFSDGLQVNEGIVSVLIDGESEAFLSVSESGVKVSGVQDAIDAERDRAISAETALDEKIDQEIADRIADVDEEKTRAISAETALDEKIEAETVRATEAETALDEKIKAETERATSEEARIETKLDNEITRATQTEQALDNKINTLSDNLASEVTRAQAAEQELSTRLTTEVADRKADVDEEETRAISAETALGAKIDQEIDDRAADVDAEQTRAETAEAALDEKIDQEITVRKAEAVASAEYVKNDVKIYLKNKNGETLSEIDCNDFIVDGMIEDVQLVESGSTSVLVITWNTDGGSKKTTIDVGDIFEADNYYTKAEIDSTVQTLNDTIDAEQARAEGAENGLSESIANEVTARADADTALQGAIEAEVTRAKGIEALKANSAEVDAALALKADKSEIPTDFYTKGEVDGKDNALQASIDANATAISAEEARAEGVEALKADKADVYTQEEVNVMMSQLLTRIKNLEEKESIVVADTAEEVASAPAGSDVVIASTEAIQALTADKEYNTITIVGGSANSGDIKAKATDKLTIDGMTINGDKGASNGRVLISGNTVDMKNVTIESGTTAYNVFEGNQNTTDSNFFTRNYNVSNMTVDNTELNHNVLNIYTLADDAVINVKNSYFNLHPEKSNILRLANYTNASGVTVNFENIDWTYENGGSSDFGWAGLIIYQPASNDAALGGDTTKIATWTFNFKNCKYNGEIVDSVNFGEHSQVIYGYGINGGGISDLSSIVTINFE